MNMITIDENMLILDSEVYESLIISMARKEQCVAVSYRHDDDPGVKSVFKRHDFRGVIQRTYIEPSYVVNRSLVNTHLLFHNPSLCFMEAFFPNCWLSNDKRNFEDLIKYLDPERRVLLEHTKEQYTGHKQKDWFDMRCREYDLGWDDSNSVMFEFIETYDALNSLGYDGIDWKELFSTFDKKTFRILSDFNEWVLETHESTLRLEIDKIMRG